MEQIERYIVDSILLSDGICNYDDSNVDALDMMWHLLARKQKDVFRFYRND